MEYVFGNTLVCHESDDAKKVTFHKNINTRTVTKEGDLFDPSGTLSGGSRPEGIT
jgi:structural maintenance of chromosome 2